MRYDLSLTYTDGDVSGSLDLTALQLCAELAARVASNEHSQDVALITIHPNHSPA